MTTTHTLPPRLRTGALHRLVGPGLAAQAACLAAAVLVTTVLVGSQLLVAAHYNAEAQTQLSAQKAAPQRLTKAGGQRA